MEKVKIPNVFILKYLPTRIPINLSQNAEKKNSRYVYAHCFRYYQTGNFSFMYECVEIKTT